jgi:hypothetical protein
MRLHTDHFQDGTPISVHLTYRAPNLFPPDHSAVFLAPGLVKAAIKGRLPMTFERRALPVARALAASFNAAKFNVVMGYCEDNLL